MPKLNKTRKVKHVKPLNLSSGQIRKLHLKVYDNQFPPIRGKFEALISECKPHEPYDPDEHICKVGWLKVPKNYDFNKSYGTPLNWNYMYSSSHKYKDEKTRKKRRWFMGDHTYEVILDK